VICELAGQLAGECVTPCSSKRRSGDQIHLKDAPPASGNLRACRGMSRQRECSRHA